MKNLVVLADLADSVDMCPTMTGALGNEGQLPLLPGCPWLRDTVEGCQQWLVVSPQLELMALQSKPEVADGLEGGQELSVKGRVLTFSCCQLLGEETQWPPSFYLFLLQDTSDVGVGGVGGQGELRQGEQVPQRGGGGQGGLDGVEGLLQGVGPVQHLWVTF